MKRWINYLMGQVRKFSVLDFAFFKMALLSAGILLGSYFAAFFQSHVTVVWIVFAVSLAIVFYATFGRRRSIF